MKKQKKVTEPEVKKYPYYVDDIYWCISRFSFKFSLRDDILSNPFTENYHDDFKKLSGVALDDFLHKSFEHIDEVKIDHDVAFKFFKYEEKEVCIERNHIYDENEKVELLKKIRLENPGKTYKAFKVKGSVTIKDVTMERSYKRNVLL